MDFSSEVLRFLSLWEDPGLHLKPLSFCSERPSSVPELDITGVHACHDAGVCFSAEDDTIFSALVLSVVHLMDGVLDDAGFSTSRIL